MPPGHRFDRLFQVGIDVGIVQDCLGMNADVVVDNEFQTRQTDTGIGQLAKIKGQLGIADVHHDLDTNARHLAPLYFRHLGLEQAVVNEAGVALGAAHRNQHAIPKNLAGIATPYNGRDT